MDDAAQDSGHALLVTSCFQQIATRGWARLSIPQAARAAGIELNDARERIPDRYELLKRFGSMADAHTLRDAPSEGKSRDRLFDLTMRRIDFFQRYRLGVIALLDAIPFDPPTSVLVGRGTLRSMAWLLEASGIEILGLKGCARVTAMTAIWTGTVRTWAQDPSPDLDATMAALDDMLSRAERIGGWLSI
jgi:hypothetical protein